MYPTCRPLQCHVSFSFNSIPAKIYGINLVVHHHITSPAAGRRPWLKHCWSTYWSLHATIQPQYSLPVQWPRATVYNDQEQYIVVVPLREREKRKGQRDLKRDQWEVGSIHGDMEQFLWDTNPLPYDTCHWHLLYYMCSTTKDYHLFFRFMEATLFV